MNSKVSNPWYKNVHRWGQTNLTEDDPVKCDLAFWREQWKRTALQGLIVNCGGIVAYYPSKDRLQYKAHFLGDKDYFGEWVYAAREEGLTVLARMDINRVASQEFFEMHPEWFCRDKNGNPCKADEFYLSCVNSDYYKEYIPSILREIIEMYHPDGFVDNSWKGMGKKSICYCQNCQKKFNVYSGHNLPDKSNWNDDVYREWVRWSYDCRIENWDLFNKVTMEAGGKDCLWIGMIHADPVGAGGAFSDLKDVCDRAKIIFADHQCRDLLNGFEQNAINGSLLRFAANENLLVPESFSNYVRGDRTFRLASNPEPETRMWMLEGISGGISPWYHHVGGGKNDSRQFKNPINVFNWHQANEEYLYNRTDLANVGMVWSQQNADFYGREDDAERCALPWRGFGLSLVKSRIPFLPINIADIARYADRIKTLILPDIAVMSPEQTAAVCTFVRNGGNLVLTGNSGTMDEDGNLLAKSPLRELLGLSVTSEFLGIQGKASNAWDLLEAHTYFCLPEDRHPLLNGFEDTRIIPFGGCLQILQSTEPLKPIVGYIPAFPVYPPEFSWIRKEEPERGVLFAGTMPTGGKVVFFAADVDRCCGRIHLPDHAQLLSNAVRWASGDDFPLKVDGPGTIDCKLYSQQNRLILHLVNLSAANQYPGYLEEILPVGPVTVTLSVNGFCPKKSVALRTVDKTEIPLEFDGKTVRFILEKLDDHEMLVIE